MGTLRDLWPLTGLVVRTPRIELRWPDDDALVALAELGAGGVHPDDDMPFMTPWTRGEPVEVSRRVLQWHWGCRGRWTPEAWIWNPVVTVDGQVVGSQGMNGDDFAVRRTVSTGSWLGRRHQGRGIGTEMRAAILHLAFAGLGAERAETGAFEDNEASLTVTRRLGYRESGDEILASDGRRRRVVSFALSRAQWEQGRRHDIGIEGLAPCLPLFGADAMAAAVAGGGQGPGQVEPVQPGG